MTNFTRKKRQQIPLLRGKGRKIGGIGIKNRINADEAFEDFYTNSTLSLLANDSAYGIIFTLELNSGVSSPYYAIRSNNIFQDVTQLIVKVVFIAENNISFGIDGQTKYSVTKDNFIDEIKKQINIYSSSNQDFEPICPSIIYADMSDLSDSKINGFMQHFSSKNNYNNNAFIEFEDIKTRFDSGVKLGLIAMEMIENSQTVYSYIKNSFNAKDYTYSCLKYIYDCFLLTLYEHYRLLKCKYLHGDFHLSNALMIPSYNYIDGYNLRVVLIDFGLSYAVQTDNIDFKNLTFEELQNIMYNTFHPYRTAGFFEKPGYKWVQNVMFLFKDQRISLLETEREKTIEEFWETLKSSELSKTDYWNTAFATIGLYKGQNLIGGENPIMSPNPISISKSSKLNLISNGNHNQKNNIEMLKSEKQFPVKKTEKKTDPFGLIGVAERAKNCGITNGAILEQVLEDEFQQTEAKKILNNFERQKDVQNRIN